MPKSAFAYAFDRDIGRTVLEDPSLGERVLGADPGLVAARGADLIAGARVLRAQGALKPRLALRLAMALHDLGVTEEALEVLADDAVDFGPRRPLRDLVLAQVRLAAGDEAGGRAAFGEAQAWGPGPGGELAGTLARAFCGAPAADWTESVQWAQAFLVLGLADPAARVIQTFLERPEALAPQAVDALVASAFAALRLASASAALRLLQAMAPLYALEGRAESHRSTVETLAGGRDLGVEAEPAEPSERRLALRACLAEACAAARRWPEAVRRLDFVGKTDRDPPDALRELARCIGRDLDGHGVRLAPPGGPRRIVDVFAFNGELDLLRLKLRDMSPWVDRFVILEADTTFTGRPKPLYFQEAAAAFAEYADKIVHVVAPAPPDHIAATWAREIFQKDAAVRGIDGFCAPDDVVILSDVDEIVARDSVAGFDGDVAAGAVRTFRYFLNCELVSDRPVLKSTVTRARFLAAHGWNYLRLGAVTYRKERWLPNAGWHFTSVGDAERLARKMQSTSHEEWAHLDGAYFEKMLRKLKRGGLSAEYVRREIDDSFPAAIRDNREELAALIL